MPEWINELMYPRADFFVHLSDSKLVGKSRASLSIWRVTSVVPAFCNFFFILTYRLSMAALTSYHWVRWHPSTILRTVGARSNVSLSLSLSPLPLLLPPFFLVDPPVFSSEEKKSARSARIGAFRSRTRE